MRTVWFRLVMVVAVLAGGLGGLASSASASSSCRALPAAWAHTAGGYSRANWMRGQVITLDAWGYLYGLPSSACLGVSQQVDWTMTLTLGQCGKVPVLATGTSAVTVVGLRGSLLERKSYTAA